MVLLFGMSLGRAMQSIKINGVLDGLTATTASGWINVTGNVDKMNSKPFITISVNGEIFAEGFATTSRPDIEKLGGLAFGFSLNLKKEISDLKSTSDFSVIAKFHDIKKPLEIYKPIELFLQFSSLASDRQLNFISRIAPQIEKLFLHIQPSNVLVAKNRLTLPVHKLCVISYANDAGAWFPYFYKHYVALVGETGVYVVTPKPESFDSYKLGGVITCANIPFDDDARSQLISGIATGLQAYYRWTLVCDVDEIVMPNPQSGLDFFESLDMFDSQDVIVSRGFDILQMEDEEDFSFDLPVLEQRRFANPNMALCKPCLAKLPIQYSGGFHYCNYRLKLPPLKEGFITLHLKFACKNIRKEVADIVKNMNFVLEKTADYCLTSVSEQALYKRRKFYLDKNIEGINSIAMQEFEKKYTQNLVFSSARGLWIGEHLTAPFLIDLKSN
jgi:hypothetical protein